MKKIFCVIVMLIMIVVFTGCEGNRSTNDHNNTLNIIHICDLSGNCVDYNIQTWYESHESGIGVKTTDGNYIWCSEGTYILAQDYCPICGRK